MGTTAVSCWAANGGDHRSARGGDGSWSPGGGVRDRSRMLAVMSSRLAAEMPLKHTGAVPAPRNTTGGSPLTGKKLGKCRGEDGRLLLLLACSVSANSLAVRFNSAFTSTTGPATGSMGAGSAVGCWATSLSGTSDAGIEFLSQPAGAAK